MREKGGVMKNKSYGYKCYRKNLDARGGDQLLEVVTRTRMDIDRHYAKPFEADNLMKRWSRLEYHARQRFNVYFPVAVGFGIGFLTAFYFFLMSLREISESLWALIGLTVLFLALLALALFLIVRQTEKGFDDPYMNFILEYEKKVLADKLREGYGFSVDGGPKSDSLDYDLDQLELFEDQ